MPEWSAVVNTTAARYLKGASDETVRERVVFALMQKRKRILYDWDGKEVTQQHMYGLPETEAYSGGTIDFEASDVYRQTTHNWRQYITQDKMTEKDRAMNSGVPQLVNRYANIMKNMRSSMTAKFGTELYVDGATYTDRMEGMETFCADDAATVVGDLVARPSDNYGGQSTIPGTLAGSWSTDLSTKPNAVLAVDWPSGSGDPEFDWLSPKLINYTSTNWGTGTNTWLDNCEISIRRGILWCRLTGGAEGTPNIVMLGEDLYSDYMQKQEAKTRIIVPYKEVQDLGFPEGARQEGASIMTEFGMTSSIGYLINPNKMEMRILGSQLFTVKGPEWDIRTMSWLFLMYWMGNLYFQPKYFGKLKAYASA